MFAQSLGSYLLHVNIFSYRLSTLFNLFLSYLIFFVIVNRIFLCHYVLWLLLFNIISKMICFIYSGVYMLTSNSFCMLILYPTFFYLVLALIFWSFSGVLLYDLQKEMFISLPILIIDFSYLLGLANTSSPVLNSSRDGGFLHCSCS